MPETEFSVYKACDELKINKEIYLRIVMKAFEQTAADLLKLHTAHAANDIPAIQAIAHRLKGDYANLRMKALSDAAAELNMLAKTEYNATRALELIEQFHVVFEEMKLAIEGVL